VVEITEVDEVEQAKVSAEAVEEEDSRAAKEEAHIPNKSTSSSFHMELGEKHRQ
jgi:hypothetical protein